MRRTKLSLLLVLSLGSGCDWFEDPTPEQARLLINGDVGATIQLIVSSKFVAGVSDAGITRVEIGVSDTIVTTLPFDQRFDIRGDYRFFVQAARLDTDLTLLRMQVFVDDDREFDEDGPLLTGAPFRFLFQFNQFFTDAIEVVF